MFCHSNWTVVKSLTFTLCTKTRKQTIPFGIYQLVCIFSTNEVSENQQRENNMQVSSPNLTCRLSWAGTWTGTHRQSSTCAPPAWTASSRRSSSPSASASPRAGWQTRGWCPRRSAPWWVDPCGGGWPAWSPRRVEGWSRSRKSGTKSYEAVSDGADLANCFDQLRTG